MFHLGVRAARLAQRPIFPERLDENGPRQGFFEHAEYEAMRRHLPRPYQDVLDFAYFSGWRKREILELRWDEGDAAGGVVRLSPARSKTRVGRVLPISAPIAAVLSRRRATRQPGAPLVFTRDDTTVRAWRRAWPAACRQAGVPGRLLLRLPPDDGAESGPRRGAGTHRDGADGASDTSHLRSLLHGQRSRPSPRRGTARDVSRGYRHECGVRCPVGDVPKRWSDWTARDGRAIRAS